MLNRLAIPDSFSTFAERKQASMKLFREILGYTLGGVLFVGLMPTLMWLASGKPALWPVGTAQIIIAAMLILLGLALSVWTIIYMRHKGDGNPMDAFNHEVAPRTKHLMTDGPYRINRNPMLTGILLYLIGICIGLWAWQALLVFVVFFAIMLVQVKSEEKRLRRDFGEEYEEYCRRTRAF